MKWTKTPPFDPGIYWVKPPDYDKPTLAYFFGRFYSGVAWDFFSSRFPSRTTKEMLDLGYEFGPRRIKEPQEDLE